MLITEDYRALNRALHESRDDYGRSGHRWAPLVERLILEIDARSVLDYGAGKGTLAAAFAPGRIRQYDPCVPGLDQPPEPADLVVCTDVLEHIEPECLDDVLDDLARVTERIALLVVATRPAVKTLPDGRNAHLIQQPATWWLPRILARFDLHCFEEGRGEFVVLGRKSHECTPPSPGEPGEGVREGVEPKAP